MQRPTASPSTCLRGDRHGQGYLAACMRLVDLTGKRYGRLVVLERAANRNRKTFWRCRCDCGNAAEVASDALKATRKPTRSCGCLAAEYHIDRASTDPVCRRPTRKHPNGRTGKIDGYLAHYYLGEDPCEACREGARREHAQRRIEDPVRTLRDNLWRKYRLTLERYESILEAQDRRCAICLTDAPRDVRTGRFHVDHDHSCCPGTTSCGECVRGLLCHACNTALGNFADDRTRLLRAIDYLDRRRRESIPAAAVRVQADAAESGAA